MRRRPVKVIRRDLDGSKILQTAGSLGFQVWFRGRFRGWFACPSMADSFLRKLQSC